MTVSQQYLLETLLWIAGPTATVFGVLLALIWRQVNRQFDIIHKRLQTLGHEDRDIRNQINNVMLQLLDAAHQSNPSTAVNDSELMSENKRLRYLIREYKRQFSSRRIDDDEQKAG